MTMQAEDCNGRYPSARSTACPVCCPCGAPLTGTAPGLLSSSSGSRRLGAIARHPSPGQSPDPPEQPMHQMQSSMHLHVLHSTHIGSPYSQAISCHLLPRCPRATLCHKNVARWRTTQATSNRPDRASNATVVGQHRRFRLEASDWTGVSGRVRYTSARKARPWSRAKVEWELSALAFW